MSYWLRAAPEQHVMLAGARGSVVTLAPGQAVAYDHSPAHDATIAEVRAGTSPLELIEADSDPSLPREPDEAERDLAEREERTRRRAQAHTQRLEQGDNPSPPMDAAPTEEAPMPVPMPVPTPTPEEIPS